MQPFRFETALAAVMLVAGAAMAGAQPAPAPAPEFTTERRDALRRIWQRDPAIRDYVGPGDAERLDAQSDYYSEDYTARQSLAAEPPTEGAGVAIAAGREPAP